MMAQNSDRYTLEETLESMRRIGVAPEDYVIGYADGFRDAPYKKGMGLAYGRGRSAGLEAWGRGAHGSRDLEDAPYMGGVA